MDPKVVQQVIAALTKVAEKLGKAGSYVWELAIRQQYINGFIWAVVFLLLLIATISFFWQSFKRYRLSTKKGSEDGSFLLFGFFGIVVGIITLCVLQSTLTALLNPEYAALQSLIESVKR